MKSDSMEEEQMEQATTKTYQSGVNGTMMSILSGTNKVTATNKYAVPVVR